MDFAPLRLPSISGARPKRTTRLMLYVETIAVDAVVIVAGQVASGILRDNPATLAGWKVGTILLLLYLAFASTKSLYGIRSLEPLRRTVSCALHCFFLSVVGFTFVAYFSHFAEEVSRFGFVGGIALSTLGLVAGRMLIRRQQLRLLGPHPIEELVITDGVNFRCRPDRMKIDAGEWDLQPDLERPEMPRRFGQLVEGFDRVIVACSPAQYNSWVLLLRASNVRGEIVAPELNANAVLAVSRIDGYGTYVVARGALSLIKRAQKRALDLAVVIPAIICLAPLLCLVAILIKLESRGPVLFLQDRVGRNNQLFRIFKFRSMRVEAADANGGRSASRDDDRITRVGRFIRATSIDELPQLFNVLLGDMSLVGPRPHALGSLAGDKLFWEVDHQYWMRHSLKPGITGLAQVRGYRGATENQTDLTNRLRSDLEYIANWSLIQELEILVRTALVVVHRNAF